MIANLPTELIWNILKFIDFYDIFNLSYLSKNMESIILNYLGITDKINLKKIYKSKLRGCTKHQIIDKKIFDPSNRINEFVEQVTLKPNFFTSNWTTKNALTVEFKNGSVLYLNIFYFPSRFIGYHLQYYFYTKKCKIQIGTISTSFDASLNDLYKKINKNLLAKYFIKYYHLNKLGLNFKYISKYTMRDEFGTYLAKLGKYYIKNLVDVDYMRIKDNLREYMEELYEKPCPSAFSVYYHYNDLILKYSKASSNQRIYWNDIEILFSKVNISKLISQCCLFLKKNGIKRLELMIGNHSDQGYNSKRGFFSYKIVISHYSEKNIPHHYNYKLGFLNYIQPLNKNKIFKNFSLVDDEITNMIKFILTNIINTMKK